MSNCLTHSIIRSVVQSVRDKRFSNLYLIDSLIDSSLVRRYSDDRSLSSIMKYSAICVCLLALVFVRLDCRPKDDALNKDEEQAKQYLKQLDKEITEQIRIYSEAQWAYATNISEETSEAQVSHLLAADNAKLYEHDITVCVNDVHVVDQYHRRI